MNFDGRVALVTGGASGIGAGVVDMLRERGAEVHVFDAANGQDVRDADQLRACVDALPRLDILVCSAGVAGTAMPLEDLPVDEWERVMSINATGTFLSNRAAIPKLRANGYGRIVNVASIAGKEGNPLAAVYSASKAAIIAMTKSIGKELAGTGVLANSIAPALVETPLLAPLPADHLDHLLERVPLRRLATVEEIAASICWLASEQMSFATGTCLDASGGRATY
ncbi:SDR family NAD(P)-dependent oxidoreductase [Streptomyces sp. NBC_00258]|uniref:SDR family NAD(P)-dependent oxidoreductase n=1 Tax=Streptomyces sp. NBC_00258 TaxID=2903642 RepID=UPI002E28C373|nr:SDR family NAD(P)-dependent oxidoreductase [Streptomyces sp. NBC_00258]